MAATLLLGSSALPALAQAQEASPVIEIRKARLSPAPGFSRMPFGYPEYLFDELRRPPYSLGVYVSDRPLLSEEDLEIRDATPSSRALQLTFTLTTEGAARLESEVQLGEHLATLVDTRLVGVAPLNGYLGTEFPIFATLWMPRSAAESAATRLRARMPN